MLKKNKNYGILDGLLALFFYCFHIRDPLWLPEEMMLGSNNISLAFTIASVTPSRKS